MIDHHSPSADEADSASKVEDELFAERQRQAAIRALKRFVFRHNCQALTLAAFSLVAAAILWSLLYLLAYWFTLVTVTVSRSFNPNTILEINDPGLVGAQFRWWFCGGALLSLIVARLFRAKFRIDSLREAKLFLFWIVAELLIAIPNVTFSVWGNLSALVRLRRSEAADAWRLLERLHAENGRLSTASLRLEIEDERELQRVMFTLQIIGLVDMREKREGWFLCLQNPTAFASLSQAEVPE